MQSTNPRRLPKVPSKKNISQTFTSGRWLPHTRVFAILHALLCLLLIGCASSQPSEALRATGELQQQSGAEAEQAYTSALRNLGFKDSDPVTLNFEQQAASGQLADSLTGELEWRFDRDEFDRRVWQPSGFELIFKEEQQRLKLQELLFPQGRFVLDLDLASLSVPKAQEATGLFLYYPGDQTENSTGRGETTGNVRLQGKQTLKIRGQTRPSTRLDFEVEFEFEEACELVKDQPKVSEVSLVIRTWHDKAGLNYIVFKLTARRGPVRVNLLEYQGQSKS